MLYTRLDFLSYEIRLLNIQEASDDEGGDLQSKKKIVEIRHTLEAALRQLRSRGYIRVWINALCINQSDDEERGLQIRNMRQIYSQAIYVIVWLGDDPDSTANAVKYLFENKRYVWFSGRRRTAVDGMTFRPRIRVTEEEKDWDIQRWRIFQPFFKLMYWRRVWVIQEIASSRRVQVLFGREALEWRHITDALAHWEKHSNKVPKACASYKYAAELDHFRIRYKNPRPISLFEAIQWSQYALATDQRDKIYALLGLTSDGPRLVPIPNYQRSFEKILCDLTEALLTAAKSLDQTSMNFPDHPKEGWPWWDAMSLKLWSEINTALGSQFCPLNTKFSHVLIQRAPDAKSLHTQGILLGQLC